MKYLIPLAVLAATSTATPHAAFQSTSNLVAGTGQNPWCWIKVNLTDVLPHSLNRRPTQTTISTEITADDRSKLPWASSIKFTDPVPFSNPPTQRVDDGKTAVLTGIGWFDQPQMTISWGFAMGPIDWLSFRYIGNQGWDDNTQGCSRSVWVNVAGQYRTRQAECWFWCAGR